MQALPTVFPWMCPLDNAVKLLYKQGIGSMGNLQPGASSMFLKTSFGEYIYSILHIFMLPINAWQLFFINGHTIWKANFEIILKKLTTDRKCYLQMLNAFLHHRSTFSNCLPSVTSEFWPAQLSFRLDLSASKGIFFCGKAIVISHIRWLIKFSPLKGWLVSWCQ